MTGKAYVIGAGMAGLSAATILAERGVLVTVLEGASQAGGRCRSYFDNALNGVIDNGNHLVLSGNRAVKSYVRRIGASAGLVGPVHAEFAFVDLVNNQRWRLNPSEGAIPFWICKPSSRVPGTSISDYLQYMPLLWANKKARIEDIVKERGPLWRQLMHPFLLAVLNTEPEGSSAALAGAVLRATLAKGGRHYQPRIANPSLASVFVDPALEFLQSKGATMRLGARVRELPRSDQGVLAIETGEATLPIGLHDAVILAVPPWGAKDLVPCLRAPDEFRAIVNAHFRFSPPAGAPPILGVIGGMAEWIFTFPDRISVTVSSADTIVDQDREDLARQIWTDVARALEITAPLPTWQVVKEKRATFAATPAQDGKRPGAHSRWSNLFLAGDWTQTGLPATIEGALRSGETAASLALKHLAL